MSMRWYGVDDAVTLAKMRQIPGMSGIVSALYDYEPGEVWPVDAIAALKAHIEAAGLDFVVVESIPVHEAIKLGLPQRDALIDNFCASIRHVAQVGISVICYNFMPVFDWMRTNLALPLPDGSTALGFSQDEMWQIDLGNDAGSLPGWSQTFGRDDLTGLLAQYAEIDEPQLRDNLIYFMEAITPVAREAGVQLALHPDDPPWSIFGLPRVVKNRGDLRRLFNAVPDTHNGITFCTGSYGAAPDNNLIDMIDEFGERIHFVHARNVKRVGDKVFHEVAHPSHFGDVAMRDVVEALLRIGFDGPIRPDHGRMIWGEQGRAGYGLYDRALGAMYLQGLIEGVAGQ